MKLSQYHEDRIEAFDGLHHSLSEIMPGAEIDALLQRLKEVARLLIEAAPDDADPGRLTHAIDCLRASVEGLNAATDIGYAKKRRLVRETEAAEPAKE